MYKTKTRFMLVFNFKILKCHSAWAKNKLYIIYNQIKKKKDILEEVEEEMNKTSLCCIE